MTLSHFCLQQRQQEQDKVKKLLCFTFASSALLHGTLALLLPNWSFKTAKKPEPIEFIVVEQPKAEVEPQPQPIKQNPLPKIQEIPPIKQKITSPQLKPKPLQQPKPSINRQRSIKVEQPNQSSKTFPANNKPRINQSKPLANNSSNQNTSRRITPSQTTISNNDSSGKINTPQTIQPPSNLRSTKPQTFNSSKISNLARQNTTNQPNSNTLQRDNKNKNSHSTNNVISRNSTPPPRPQPKPNANLGVTCISNCQPKYPSVLAGVEGSTGMKLTINSQGNVIGVKVIAPNGNSQLNKQALLAARRMRFSKPPNGGIASVNVTIRFTVAGSDFHRQAIEKQRERERIAAEKKKQQELERQRQLEAEKKAQQERLRQQQLEQNRQAELERQRQLETEKKAQQERLRQQQLEQNRQAELERQRQLETEKKAQQERLRQQQLEQNRQTELERQRQLEAEKKAQQERLRQQQLEQNRQAELERQRQLEAEKKAQQERLRQQQLEREEVK